MPERIPGTNRWILDDDDVVRDVSVGSLYDASTFVVEEFQIAQYKRQKGESSYIFRMGVRCRLHSVTKHPAKWVNGTLRYVLEFQPGNPSELEDIDDEMLAIEADVVESNSLQITETSQALEEIRRLGSQ